MSNFTSTDTIVGTWIAIIASAVSVVGVFFNNILLQHTTAMQIWVVSNALFILFFYGQAKGYWNGGLSSATICFTYAFMLVTGVYGLMQ